MSTLPLSAAWCDTRRILCVRLDNMGDVLMTTPAIAALKRGLPRLDGAPCERHVTLWGSQAGCAIARLVPEIDATIAYDAPWVAAGRDTALEERAYTRLAAHRFDAAVVFTTFSQSALPAATLCALAGIPIVLAHVRENPYALVSHWVRDPEPDGGIRHEVERQLALVASIGAVPLVPAPRLSLAVPGAAADRAREMRRQLGIDADAPFVVVHPGASAASRRWPADRFGEVSAFLSSERGLHVLVTGAADERDLTRAVVERARGSDRVARSTTARVHDVAGRLALDELVATIADATIVVANNSGPVHIAAACGTPVIDLYALTNPQHTPWQVRHRVLSHDVPCRDCFRSVCPEGHHLCLRGVGSDDAIDAAVELLGDAESAHGRPAIDAGRDPVRELRCTSC